MKYQAVFFDVGGTLMSMDREMVAREYVMLARVRGVTLEQEAARRMFATLDDEIPARARTAPPLSLDEKAGELFWTTLFADGWSRLGLKTDNVAIKQMYTKFRRGDFNRLFSDTEPALEALRKRGVMLGIVSNFNSNCEQVLQTLGIAHYFSHIIVSATVRVEKPAREIFDIAAREAKLAGKEIVYVGDGLHSDVEGAQGAGWNAILLDRDNWYPDYTVVPRIRKLTELDKLV